MQPAKPDQKPKNENISFSRLALALADDYESVYLIDLTDDSYVEYSAAGADKTLVQRSSGADFFADVPENTRRLVYHEDQEAFLNTFRKENMMAAVRSGKSFTLDYRLVLGGRTVYYFLKAIRGAGADDRYVVIGVQNVDEQRRRELAAETERRTYSEIAESLASLFEVIYYIDIQTNRYHVYSSSRQFSALGMRTEGEDFFCNMKRDISGFVHPEDQGIVLDTLDKEKLLARLRENGSCSINYRQLLGGRTQYVNLLAFRKRDCNDSIVIGVRNIDEQMRRERAAAAEFETYSQIAGALASRYEVIYYIDVETNEYLVYSSSEQYAKLGTTKKGQDFFEDCVRDVRAYIHPEDSPRLLQELRKEQLLHNLKQSGTVSLTYRQMLADRSQYVTMIVVRPKNDKRHIVMGVINIDAQMRREQSMLEETTTFGEIIKALAGRYEVIYYVDISSGAYYEYSSSDKYARLAVGATGSDFFGDTQRNMKRDIFPDDLPLMQKAMEKETLLRSLEETGSATLNYRLILEGRPQYMTLFITRSHEKSNHIILALANVDVSVRRELAYREALGSAMDLASRDALTGVKNKHAYVQTEMELDGVISSGTPVAFAVVVCDVNGLKHVNDTQGHSAGDAFIKAACAIICTNFKHSPVFRIGGDEFAVILRGQDFDTRIELMHSLRESVEQNRQNGLVTVASGISEYLSGTDLRVQDVFERADSAMYENKKQSRRTSE